MEKNRKEYIGRIEKIESVALDTFKLQISSPLKAANPGQFISILCENKTLRRPFSIADFEDGILTIIFKLRGEGTNWLSSLKEGDEINFLAPLGNGFEIERKKALLVGAGIGVAPMLFLKKELSKNNIENYLITGFKAREEIIQGSDENVIGGSVLDNLDKLINAKKIEIIYSCGPTPVLKGVAKLAKQYNITSMLAMEKVMACSIGVCRGCVIKLMNNGEITQASICKDGPVFLGSEIIWD